MKKDQIDDKRTVRDFVPTELGSAIQANVSGRPTDKEIMIAENSDPANKIMDEKERVENPVTRS